MTPKIKRGLGEEIRMRHEEQRLLQGIAAATSLDFAERVADALDSTKHPYSFEAYMGLLERLHALVFSGVPGWPAIEIVQTCDSSFDDIFLPHC